MLVNLIDSLKDKIGSQIASQSSLFLGEEESKITTSLDYILPALLDGFILNSGDMELFNKVQENKSERLGKLTNLFAGDKATTDDGNSTTELMNEGDDIVNIVFGNKFKSILELISNGSGIKKGSSSSLLRMLAPLMLESIGKHLQIEPPKGDETLDDKKEDFDRFKKFLEDQKTVVKEKTPKSMYAYMGYDPKIPISKTEKSLPAKTTGMVFWGKLLWAVVLPAFLLLSLLWFLRGSDVSKDDVGSKISETTEGIKDQVTKSAKQVVDATGDVLSDAKGDLSKMTKQATDAAGDVSDKVGKTINETFTSLSEATIKIINTIKYAEGSVTDQMNKLISSEHGVGKTVQFNDLTFATGSAQIDQSTQKEVDNLAILLKAVPTMVVEIGGHTDNTGQASTNLSLSQERANAVRNRLSANGISTSRVSAKGYGQLSPKASNATEEGRAANRRIEVKVIKR